MPNRAAKFSTDYLTREQMRDALVALPKSLLSILGSHIVIASYGVAARIHSDFTFMPMRDHTEVLQYLIEDSIEQKIITPGESDFLFEVPEKRLQITFCHESDIHVDGEDEELLRRFMASEPFVHLHWHTQEDVKRMME